MSQTDLSTDVIVIGAGIAGMSVAAELSKHTDVVVLERETPPGYHATGRSAAYFSPAYGNATVRGLTELSAAFYKSPPDGFAPVPLLHTRDALHVAPQGYKAQLADAIKTIRTLNELSVQDAIATVPILEPDYVAAAAIEVGGGDLDVDAILQGYVRQFKANGGTLLTSAEVREIEKHNDLFQVTCSQQRLSAQIVVNASGAWADSVATLAGIAPLNLTPKRRTAFLVPAPENYDSQNWPLVINQSDPLYFKPDAGTLLLSPMDETSSPPCDAAPQELDVAEAIARFEASTTLRVARVTHRWAGLRTFSNDDTFIVGFEPNLPGFFWLAGQGGYGVQTAPALSRLAAGLICDNLGKAAHSKGQEWAFKETLAPARFRP